MKHRHEKLSTGLVVFLFVITVLALSACGTNRCGHRQSPGRLEPMLMQYSDSSSHITTHNTKN